MDTLGPCVLIGELSSFPRCRGSTVIPFKELTNHVSSNVPHNLGICEVVLCILRIQKLCANLEIAH